MRKGKTKYRQDLEKKRRDEFFFILALTHLERRRSGQLERMQRSPRQPSGDTCVASPSRDASDEDGSTPSKHVRYVQITYEPDTKEAKNKIKM